MKSYLESSKIEKKTKQRLITPMKKNNTQPYTSGEAVL